MKKLHSRASGYQCVSIVPVSAPCQKQNEGPQPLAAGTDQAEHEIGHTWKVDPNGFFQPRLHLQQVRSHGGKDVTRPDINHRPLRTERTTDLIPVATLVARSGV